MLVGMNDFESEQDVGTAEAQRRLDSVSVAQNRSARAARRPVWYSIGLGLGLGLALASFGLGLETVGIVFGAVLVPVALDLEVRRRAGRSPLRDYFSHEERGLTVAWVLLVAAVCFAALVLYKLQDLAAAPLVGGVVVAVLTAVLGRGLDARRTTSWTVAEESQ